MSDERQQRNAMFVRVLPIIFAIDIIAIGAGLTAWFFFDNIWGLLIPIGVAGVIVAVILMKVSAAMKTQKPRSIVE